VRLELSSTFEVTLRLIVDPDRYSPQQHHVNLPLSTHLLDPPRIMLQLPNELLDNIVAYIDASPREDGLRNVQTLSALSKCSRRLRDATQPVLFRRFEIYDKQLEDPWKDIPWEDRKKADYSHVEHDRGLVRVSYADVILQLADVRPLVLFTRSVVENPHLGRFVKQLHFSTQHTWEYERDDYTPEDDLDYLPEIDWEILCNARPLIKTPPTKIEASDWMAMVKTGSIDALATILISKTPLVESLYMQPSWARESCAMQYLYESTHMIAGTSQQYTGFAALKTIHLVAMDWPISGNNLAPSYAEVPFPFPQVTSFACQNMQMYSVALFPNGSNLSALEMRDCFLTTKCLHSLLSAINRLKRFAFTSSSASPNPFRPTDLHSALQKHRETLEYLATNFDAVDPKYDWNYDTDAPGMGSFPSLRSFTKLNTVMLEYDRVPSLRDYLPECLEYLAFENRDIAPLLGWRERVIDEDAMSALMVLKQSYPALKEVFVESESPQIWDDAWVATWNGEVQLYNEQVQRVFRKQREENENVPQVVRYVSFPQLDYTLYIGPFHPLVEVGLSHFTQVLFVTDAVSKKPFEGILEPCPPWAERMRRQN
jgi:hypothetical protein